MCKALQADTAPTQEELGASVVKGGKAGGDKDCNNLPMAEEEAGAVPGEMVKGKGQQ